ncbi:MULTISPECIES: ABC transporter ATP-binding protein [unclassified Chelatococcus]|uniref:ABC transporter ATP-binding protein n=1 Tax=unclassified Chelatococcus TaxID=2638111 RepID=UPI001BD10DDF|nr:MULTISPECIES: ABC transporter ATP-binding protein [unclassified Chelatococcus]CAH1673706.1 dipeptide ABC transporter ATP binding subunit DppD [Hyphomicrobiales bacterium]MBS7738791.1 ABC transporter ATP-binding protein [Chelatococcus sp. HY11]MBX3543195.1 ABC transporter ATP-binding protein [Chelatococcus sp.]MCO5076678.1 ABC transporter ATP-binding protein [Chelatococcus sp.]CAH1674044.1 dipeptide ABC transporter ATP binding subunit DppD [Hyphomicrobiales bacterium]
MLLTRSSATESPAPLLSIRGLKTCFPTRAGLVTAVDGVDLDVQPGECLGIVGESGSGKSVTFASVIGLVRPPGRIAEGSIHFDGADLRTLDPSGWRRLRGRDIAMTMQDALTALNPALTVAEQICEVLIAHAADLPRRNRRRSARERAIEMLRLVGIPAAESRMDDYPHQFSGGMRQRIMIAIALACRPKLLIADEPTTALDVTIQAQVLDLISDLRRELGMSVVLITHDLGVVAEHTDRVAVMYAGQIVETGPTRDLIEHPRHPYTRGLIGLIPRLSDLDAPIKPIEGRVPELIGLGGTCRFHDRCEFHRPECRHDIPMLPVGVAHEARCIRAGEDLP